MARTQFIDYDSRRIPKTNFSCVKCQRDLNPKQPYRVVVVDSGEPFAYHSEDISLARDPVRHPIGMDCARKLGLEWTLPATELSV